MIKKAFLILISTTLAVAGAGVGSHEKDLVVKAFNNKTPAFVMKQLGRKLDFSEQSMHGFPRWGYELDREGGEELLIYKVILLSKSWKVQDSKKLGGGWRRVFSFEAHFYRPIGKGRYICWDAFYHLLPAGYDYEKEQRKIEEERFGVAGPVPLARRPLKKHWKSVPVAQRPAPAILPAIILPGLTNIP